MTRRSWPRSAARVSRRHRSGPQVFVDRFCDTGFEHRSAAAAYFAGDIVRFASGTHGGHVEQACHFRPAFRFVADSPFAVRLGAADQPCRAVLSVAQSHRVSFRCRPSNTVAFPGPAAI